MATLDISDVLGKVGDELLGVITKHGDELVASLKKKAPEAAKQIAGYYKRIGEVIAKRALGKMKVIEANLAVKNWETASRSALKKVENWTAWELHGNFWSIVKEVLGIITRLRGVI